MSCNLRNFRQYTRISDLGRLAQLEERLVYTEKVGGSNPSPPTTIISDDLKNRNRCEIRNLHVLLHIYSVLTASKLNFGLKSRRKPKNSTFVRLNLLFRNSFKPDEATAPPPQDLGHFRENLNSQSTGKSRRRRGIELLLFNH